MVDVHAALWYISMKRVVIALECLLFLCAVLIEFFVVQTPRIIQGLMAFLASRIAAEIANIVHIQNVFGVRDQWILFPFF